MVVPFPDRLQASTISGETKLSRSVLELRACYSAEA
jgi:hypothetical protein